MKTGKKWYDDWYVAYNGVGNFEVKLPHSFSKEKSIKIKGKYTRKHIEWLVQALDCALLELTNRDMEVIRKQTITHINDNPIGKQTRKIWGIYESLLP